MLNRYLSVPVVRVVLGIAHVLEYEVEDPERLDMYDFGGFSYRSSSGEVRLRADAHAFELRAQVSALAVTLERTSESGTAQQKRELRVFRRASSGG